MSLRGLLLAAQRVARVLNALQDLGQTDSFTLRAIALLTICV
jgi:hypothetical protein